MGPDAIIPLKLFRSGTFSMATVIGFLLIGAMSGIGVLLGVGDYPLLALTVAALAAAALSLVYALLVVTLRVNQVIGGLALVFLAQGMTGVIATRAGWTSRPVEGLHTVPLGSLADIPVLGPILFQHDPLVFATVPLVALVAYVLDRTMFGLRLRAVGDGPDAADAAGIDFIDAPVSGGVKGAVAAGVTLGAGGSAAASSPSPACRRFVVMSRPSPSVGSCRSPSRRPRAQRGARRRSSLPRRRDLGRPLRR